MHSHAVLYTSVCWELIDDVPYGNNVAISLWEKTILMPEVQRTLISSVKRSSTQIGLIYVEKLIDRSIETKNYTVCLVV